MANRSPYGSAVDQLKGAYRSAFNRVRATAGKTTDRDIMFYDTLTPEDFSLMSENYGQDEILKYIRAIETRRMRGE